ncbi:MAG: hypothetical protein ABSG91_16895 [Syntrophobacteraceae bacterium]|jgi:hypothetical protein
MAPGEQRREVNIHRHRLDPFGMGGMGDMNSFPVRRKTEQAAAVDLKKIENLLQRTLNSFVNLVMSDINKPSREVRNQPFKAQMIITRIV